MGWKFFRIEVDYSSAALLGTEENVDFGHELHVGRGSRNQIIFDYGDGV